MMKKIAGFTIAATMMVAMCLPVFAAPAAAISAQQAKATALANAGFTEKDVVMTKNKLEYDDGILQYEVEFVNGQTEYEYEINATTGAILSVDIDLLDY